MRNEAAWDTEDIYERAREEAVPLPGGAGDEFADIEYATMIVDHASLLLCTTVERSP